MNEKIITSVQNPRVKDAVRLRSGRHRGKQDRFLIDGARELCRAIDAEVPLVEAFVCDSLCNSTESSQAVEMLAQSGCDLWQVSEEVFTKLAFGERACGVLAIGRTPQLTLDDLEPRGSGPIAVIEGIEKPGNVGAVLRSADAAGVAALIVANPGTDLYNPNCIRASLGAVFTLPVCVATTSETLAWLRRRGIPRFAARVDATLLYDQASLAGQVAIALGSEAEGLSSLWHADDIVPLRLPMSGVVDSLNISAAAAILFYEAHRQRTAANSK